MAADRWRCTTCRRERVVADAFPPLLPGLIDKYRSGKCKRCRGSRTFEQVRVETWNGPEPASGDRLKETGMAIAETAEALTGEGWIQRADAVIKSLALARKEFTSEDVTARVGQPHRSSGAVGARMNAAHHRGIIRDTGRMVKAQRPNQHSAKLTVWRGT